MKTFSFHRKLLCLCRKLPTKRLPKALRALQTQRAGLMSNIKIVAKLAGCSIATVSRCFNSPDLVRPVTRARIMEIATQQKFRPSIIGRQLRRKQTGMVGVMLPSVDGKSVLEGKRGSVRVDLG